MNLKEFAAQNQRLLILQMLEQDEGYSHNATILQLGLNELGHSLSHADVVKNIRWLENVGLVTVDIKEDWVIAKITREGVAVANGKRVVGVARPKPEV